MTPQSAKNTFLRNQKSSHSSTAVSSDNAVTTTFIYFLQTTHFARFIPGHVRSVKEKNTDQTLI